RRSLTRLQPFETSRWHQQRKRARQNAHLLGPAPIDPHVNVTAAVESDLVTAARQVNRQLEELGQHTCPRGPGNHAHVEEAVHRRGGWREAQEASIRLDVCDGPEAGPARYGPAVDLELKRVEPVVG